jgi:hypothetical protein
MQRAGVIREIEVVDHVSGTIKRLRPDTRRTREEVRFRESRHISLQRLKEGGFGEIAPHLRQTSAPVCRGQPQETGKAKD